jgi:hypothetical protein
MRFPPEIILLVAEHLDAPTLFALLRTCKGLRQLLMKHEHSIAKGWISRVLPPQISDSATDILSSTDFHAPNDPINGCQPRIIKRLTFTGIKELDLRGRRIDALFAEHSADAPRGVGLLLKTIKDFSNYNTLPQNKAQFLLQGLKEACRLADHLGDFSASVQPSTIPAFVSLLGFDKLLPTKLIQDIQVHAARHNFITSGGLTYNQLWFLGVLTDVSALAIEKANAPVGRDRFRESFLRHGTAVIDALVCDPAVTLPLSQSVSDHARKSHDQLQTYYMTQTQLMGQELTSSPSGAEAPWDKSDNLFNVLHKALKDAESAPEGEQSAQEV